MTPACVHCERHRANRARGLCWRCSLVPGVRAMYPSTSKYGRQGVGIANVTPTVLPPPCPHPPGSPGKVAELVRRAAAGEVLFREGDAGDE